MKLAKSAVLFLLFSGLIIAFLFIYSEKLTNQAANQSVNQQNQENTVRAFWSAIENNNLNAAAKLVDLKQINQGRYAKNIEQYLQTLKKVNAQRLHFTANESRVTVYSDEYNMDYDLEKSKDGKWLIVSIHP